MIPQKVAFVANTSWSIYNFRLGIIKQLQDYGIKVLVIAPKDQFTAKLVAEGVDFEHFYLDNHGTNPLNDIQSFLALVSIYKKHHLEFIFHYTIKPNIYGSLAASWCRIPCISVTTGLGKLTSFSGKLLQWFILKLYKVGLKGCKEVWFLNESDRQFFLEKKLIPKRKAIILNSEGVNTSKFCPINFDLKSGPIIFLLAGRMLWEKGVGEYIAAARIIRQKYPNIQFHLLGFIDTTDPNGIQPKQVANWQKEGVVNYLGETTDVRPYIDEADCVVLPTFYKEGISRILLEAAAMGKPIIASDQVGCREVIEDGISGFLCPPKDTSALVQRMERIILMEENERYRMGWKGREKVIKEFDESLIIDTYLSKLNLINKFSQFKVESRK